MSWVEVDGAGWSWVEVDAAGWSWVQDLVIPNIFSKNWKFSLVLCQSLR